MRRIDNTIEVATNAYSSNVGCRRRELEEEIANKTSWRKMWNEEGLLWAVQGVGCDSPKRAYNFGQRANPSIPHWKLCELLAIHRKSKTFITIILRRVIFVNAVTFKIYALMSFLLLCWFDIKILYFIVDCLPASLA